ncbi:hypothetical protein BS47DRAFT_1339158 [Hydnum rufescens UP504]|uniref:BZIP domain-containing protein n=1 Tax=Hydnum rufescens UP504 TaxID=1448309 RepID=A0A9P6B4L8_9AGAM|nr:hypothetical protein BS47DRAFT_1339158 [Hydnum rufescens UP504]
MDYVPLLHHKYYPDAPRKRGASLTPPPSAPATKSRETSAAPPPPKRPRAAPSGPISTKDWVPPDVSGLGKREARLVKNRAAAFLSRQRKREEFEQMEIRVQELETENARLRQSSSTGDDEAPDLRTQLDRSLERERTLEAQVRSLQAALLEANTSATVVAPVINIEDDVEDNDAHSSHRNARESNSVKEKEKDKEKSHSSVAFMALIFSLSLLSTGGDNAPTPTGSSCQPSGFSFSPLALPSPSSLLFSSRSPLDFSMDAHLGKSGLEEEALLNYTPHKYTYDCDGLLDLGHVGPDDHLGLDSPAGLGLGIGTGMDVGIGSISLGHHACTTRSPSTSLLRSPSSTGVTAPSDTKSPIKQVEIEIRRQSDSSDVPSDTVSFDLRVRRPQSSGDTSDSDANCEKEKTVVVRVRRSPASVTSPSSLALFTDRDEEVCSSRLSRTASPVPSLSSSTCASSSVSASPWMASSVLSGSPTKSMGQITVQLKQALDSSGDSVGIDLASVFGLGPGGPRLFGIDDDESIGSWEIVAV